MDWLISEISSFPNVKPVGKVRKGLTLVGIYGRIEISLFYPEPNQATVIFDGLKASQLFRVSLGEPIHQYGLVEQHSISCDNRTITFYSLIGELYVKEFKEGFSLEESVNRLWRMVVLGYPIMMADKQVEVFLKNPKEGEVKKMLEVVLETVQSNPYIKSVE